MYSVFCFFQSWRSFLNSDTRGMTVLYSANPVNKPLFPAVTQFTKPLKIKQCQDYVKKSLSNLPNDFIPVTSSQSMKSAQKSEVISTLRMHSSCHGFPKISQRSLVLGERRSNHCIQKRLYVF